MSDLINDAKSYVKPNLGDTQIAKLKASLSDGSLIKIPSLSKEEKASNENAAPEDLSQVSTSALTEGYAQHPRVQPATQAPADFYRRGKISQPSTSTLSQDIQQSNTFAVNSIGAS